MKQEELNNLHHVHSGRELDFLNIQISAIHIDDIIRGLAWQFRFNGHMIWPMTVAQHSIEVARRIEDMTHDNKMMRTAFLHDATEAYMRDIPRPLKNLIPAFEVWESKVYSGIAEKFDLYDPIPEMIIQADDDE